MKLCFSTLGCPKLGFGEILSIAKDLSYDGIEIRGVLHTIDAPDIREFSSEKWESTQEKMRELGLEIPILTSACYLHVVEGFDNTLAMAKRYVDTAARIGTKYIRVLGDRNPAPERPVDDDMVAARLREIAEYAGKAGVEVLIETNGAYADSARLRAVIEAAGQKNIGVIWDINHPYRYFGEIPSQTYETLGDLICHVHMKDSTMENDRLVYHMVGQGELPVKQCIELLAKGGYQGYFSLEWVKRWEVTLEEPGIAFAHYVNFMKKYM